MITLTRNSCLNYNIIVTDEHVGQEYTIETIDNTEIASGTLDASQVQDFDDEGVYVLTVGDEKYVIIEFCELFDCLVKLTTSALCAEDTAICDDCTDLEIKNIRFTLNRLIAGYGMLALAIFHERVTYTGILEIDTCRLENLQTINKFIEDLQKLKGACGDGCGNSDIITSCNEC